MYFNSAPKDKIQQHRQSRYIKRLWAAPPAETGEGEGVR